MKPITSRSNQLLTTGALALTAGWIPTGDAAEKPPPPPPEAVEAAGKAMVRTHGSMYPRTRRAPAGRAVPSAPALDHPVAAGPPSVPALDRRAAAASPSLPALARAH